MIALFKLLKGNYMEDKTTNIDALDDEIDEVVKKDSMSLSDRKSLIAISAVIIAIALVFVVCMIIFTVIKDNVVPDKGIYSEVVITQCDNDTYTAQIVAFENDKTKYEECVGSTIDASTKIVKFTSDRDFTLGARVGGYYYKGDFLKPYKEIN